MIDKKKTYGESENTTKYSGIIGVGEMWGYFMQEALYFKWKNTTYTGKYIPYSYWFKPSSLSSLYSGTNSLSISQIFACYTSDVRTISQLKNRLLIYYPDKQRKIELAF